MEQHPHVAPQFRTRVYHERFNFVYRHTQLLWWENTQIKSSTYTQLDRVRQTF